MKNRRPNAGRVRRRARVSVRTLPLAPSQLRVLDALVGKPAGVVSRELAKLAKIKTPSLYMILLRLRRGGYVETDREQRQGIDRRPYYFAVSRLTVKGGRFVASWRAFLHSVES